MSAPNRQLHLNAFLKPPGEYLAAWRHPDAPDAGGIDLDHVVALAQTAERARFDAIFLADLVGVPLESQDVLSRVSVVNDSFEPLTLLATLAMATSHIGLIATASTTYNEPEQIARLYASLDQLSGGRAGWNLVTSLNDGEANNFGLDQHVAHEDRYARAEAFHDEVVARWDGTIPGLARPPQGRPVIVQAGASERGRELASRVADVIFSGASDIPGGVELNRDIRARAEAHGRDPQSITILPALSAVVGRTISEAEDKVAVMRSLLHPRVALAHLQYWLGGFDLTQYALDDPLPELPESNQSLTAQRRILDVARAKGLTIGQLAQRIVDGERTIVGTPASVADHMQEWFEAGAADGFNVVFEYLPGTLDDFADLVIPELQRRGLFRTEYGGVTLRDHLGLRAHDLATVDT